MTRVSKFVIVTGCSGGIGQAIVNRFIDSGVRVIGIDKELPHFSVRKKDYFNFISLDLLNLSRSKYHLNELLLNVKEIVKNGKLLSLINNAAIQLINKDRDTKAKDWIESFKINVIAPALLSEIFRELLETNGGSITNIGSVHSNLTKNGFEIYASSKSALVGLTQSLALSFSPKIRVNLIQPGAVDTEMLRNGFEGNMQKLKELRDFQPLKKLVTPEEVASVAFFLTSSNAKSITGARLTIDNGISVRLHDPN